MELFFKKVLRFLFNTGLGKAANFEQCQKIQPRHEAQLAKFKS